MKEGMNGGKFLFFNVVKKADVYASCGVNEVDSISLSLQTAALLVQPVHFT
jgi:hypothetical protein